MEILLECRLTLKKKAPSFLAIILGDMGEQRAVTHSKLSQTTTEIDQGAKIYRCNQYATLGGPWHIFHSL